MTLNLSQYMFLVGLLYIINGGTALADSTLFSKTYVHTTTMGERITCNLCPPGTYLQQHCTVDGGDPLCRDCEDGYFNDVFNQAASCSKCTVKCKYEEREEMTKNCTKDANISCSCKDGFYRQGGSGPDRLCLRIEPCPAGEGVVTEGNGQSNTECVKCPKGHFSSMASFTEKCRPCRRCGEDQEVAEPCPSEKDTVCRPVIKGLSDDEIFGISFAVVAVLLLTVLIVVRLVWPGMLTKGFRMILTCCGRRNKKPKQTESHAKGDSEHGRLMDVSGSGPSLANGDIHTENGHAVFASRENETLHQVNGFPPRGSSAGNGPTLANGVPQAGNGHAAFVNEKETLRQANGVSPRGSSADEDVPQVLLNVFMDLRDNLVSPDYQHFFRLLLPNNAQRHIDEISLNYKEQYGVKEVIFRLLLKWYDLEREHATKEKFIEALEHWGRIDLVRKYSEYPGWR